VYAYFLFDVLIITPNAAICLSSPSYQSSIQVRELGSVGYIECSVGQILAEGRGALVKVSQALIKLSCQMFNEDDFEFSAILSGMYGSGIGDMLTL